MWLETMWSLRPKHFIGRRGACLLAIGYIEAIQGLATILNPLYRARPQVDVITTFVPGLALGWMWLLLGLTAMVAGFFKTGFDKYGFWAAYPMPLLWGTNYLVSGFIGNYDKVPGAGLWVVITASTIWYGFAFLILAVSGMIGAEQIRIREE